MSSLQRIHYLGPQGSFTHQAATDVFNEYLHGNDGELVPEANVKTIINAVQEGDGWGVIAWESNVEGYVVPNLDMMIDADNIAAFARVSVDIAFDAFTKTPEGMPLTEVSAHPHGLAQCSSYIESENLRPVPASSNAAACRDIQPGQVALGPRICGALYGLRTLAAGVQDYQGAHTDFLILDRRDVLMHRMRGAGEQSVGEYESVIALIPLNTGPGVLANALDVLRDAGLNMTSFISRPIKGNDGTYSFIATIDAAPWQQTFHDALQRLIASKTWIKTLAVYPRRERPNPPVTAWMLPRGGVSINDGEFDETKHGKRALSTLDQTTDFVKDGDVNENSDRVRKELLW
jgi:chorismate mutase/prephenate dehydratase